METKTQKHIEIKRYHKDIQKRLQRYKRDLLEIYRHILKMKYRNIQNLQGGFGSEHDMNLCVRKQNLESVKVTQPLRPVLSCCCMTVWPSSMNSGRPGHVILPSPPLSPSLTHTRTHNSTTKTTSIRVPAKLHFSLSGLSMPRQPRPRHGLFHDKKPKPCRSNPF